MPHWTLTQIPCCICVCAGVWVVWCGVVCSQNTLLAQRKVARRVARLVTRFWSKVDKFVIHKHRAILDAKYKTAMDGHLAFLVGQSERYSSMLKKTVLSGGTKRVRFGVKGDDHPSVCVCVCVCVCWLPQLIMVFLVLFFGQ